MLNLALGGGWAERRVANIVGDKSSGKTLLAIEAAVNFARKHADASIVYVEAEAAFDVPYAQSLGLPLDRVEFPNETEIEIQTIEDLFKDLDNRMKEDSKRPTLYIVDSFDALSDTAEMSRDIDQNTYGQNKAKKSSELFRKLIAKLAVSNFAVIIVSQVRANIGATWGKNHTRSGGKALDFYCSQVCWLSHLGIIMKARKSIKRAVGVNIKARIEKNKIGRPFREAAFPVIFDYGVEDCHSMAAFLAEVGQLDVPKSKLGFYLRKLDQMDRRAYLAERKKLVKLTRRTWRHIEESFTPSRRKYA